MRRGKNGSLIQKGISEAFTQVKYKNPLRHLPSISFTISASLSLASIHTSFSTTRYTMAQLALPTRSHSSPSAPITPYPTAYQIEEIFANRLVAGIFNTYCTDPCSTGTDSLTVLPFTVLAFTVLPFTVPPCTVLVDVRSLFMGMFAKLPRVRLKICFKLNQDH